MGPQIDPKSIENRGFVEDAFLERFWGSPGAPKVEPGTMFGNLLATISTKNRKKDILKCIRKSMPKKYRKLMQKGAKNYAKIVQISMFFRTFPQSADYAETIVLLQ